jgi:hypothetical protein
MHANQINFDNVSYQVKLQIRLNHLRKYAILSMENSVMRKHAFLAMVFENRTPTQFVEQFW